MGDFLADLKARWSAAAAPDESVAPWRAKRDVTWLLAHVTRLQELSRTKSVLIGQLGADNDLLSAAIQDLPCYVAWPSLTTYECRHDNLCPACQLRHLAPVEG